MQFEFQLQHAKLLKRYKRFLADIKLDNGEVITIHCPNTGSMRGCLDDVARAWYWDSGNDKRKYPHTFELIETNTGDLIGVNTGRANSLVKEALEKNTFDFLRYESFKAEVKYGTENSRIDFLLNTKEGKTWVEVKSVTLLESELGQGHGYFPDSVSSRGTKHLREMIAQVEQGDKAILLFCVQHTGIERVSAADHIDSVYAETLKQAKTAGVQVRVVSANITPEYIVLNRELEFI